MTNSKGSKTKKETIRTKSDKWNEKFLDKLGFSSGMTFITLGLYWFIYFVINYITTTPVKVVNSAVKGTNVSASKAFFMDGVMMHDQLLTKAMIGILIFALGVVILHLKKIAEK